MRYTKERPLTIGEPGGKTQHVVATGTLIGYDVDLHEEVHVTGNCAQDMINSGAFILVDDAEDRDDVTEPATAETVVFESPGAAVQRAEPIVAANPNRQPDPTGGQDVEGEPRAANTTVVPATQPTENTVGSTTGTTSGSGRGSRSGRSSS